MIGLNNLDTHMYVQTLLRQATNASSAVYFTTPVSFAVHYKFTLNYRHCLPVDSQWPGAGRCTELRTRSASCCHSFPLLPTGTLTLQSETVKQNIINILLINRSIQAVTELGSRFTHSVFKMCMPLSLSHDATTDVYV